MILSHYRAGTGAILIETREESRLLREVIAELPAGAPVHTVAAPSGQIKDARTGKPSEGTGLTAGYQWAQAGPARVLIVYDWHTLANTAGHWRALADALPGLRQPRNAGPQDPASLVVFCGPHWELLPANPLRGLLPILSLALPDREALATVANALCPLTDDRERVIDALCGLSADAAEQACAEVLARNNNRYNPDLLRDARRQSLRDAGLELWPAVDSIGGLTGLRGAIESEVIPWIRDDQLSIRRILCAGLPGTGKSYFARWLAKQLSCECARLSIPGLKAGIVGASEANLKRALRTLDALGQHSPIVCVMDEIDTIAREGLDGGTSSGMFSELLTWLQESTAQVLIVATLNRLDKLDAALESRFSLRFFFDLPSAVERQAVAEIHYRRLRCTDPESAAAGTAQLTEGFSSRELAESICPTVARLTQRQPDQDVIKRVVANTTPASRTQQQQLAQMRSAAQTLRRANDPEQTGPTTGRRIGHG